MVPGEGGQGVRACKLAFPIFWERDRGERFSNLVACDHDREYMVPGDRGRRRGRSDQYTTNILWEERVESESVPWIGSLAGSRKKW